MKQIQFRIADSAPQMKDFYGIHHFTGQYFGQRLTDMGQVIRMGRISQPDGKQNDLFAGQDGPVPDEQANAADPACIQAAAKDDGIIFGKIFCLKCFLLKEGAGKGLGKPPGITFCKTVFRFKYHNCFVHNENLLTECRIIKWHTCIFFFFIVYYPWK